MMKLEERLARLKSKRGSILFIVLVIMSFMVILSTAMYYTVMSNRQAVVMSYRDTQAFQTANDVLSVVQSFLFTPGTDHQELSDAVFNSGEDVVSLAENIDEGIALWNVEPLVLNEFGLPTEFIVGRHFLRSDSRVFSGGGTATIFIFINRHGDIVVEVTVDYSGRRVTSSRMYDRNEIRNFQFQIAEVTPGQHWGWEWRDDTARPNGRGWELVESGHFLYGNCTVQGETRAWDRTDGRTVWARRMPGATEGTFVHGPNNYINNVLENGWLVWVGSADSVSGNSIPSAIPEVNALEGVGWVRCSEPDYGCGNTNCSWWLGHTTLFPGGEHYICDRCGGTGTSADSINHLNAEQIAALVGDSVAHPAPSPENGGVRQPCPEVMHSCNLNCMPPSTNIDDFHRECTPWAGVPGNLSPCCTNPDCEYYEYDEDEVRVYCGEDPLYTATATIPACGPCGAPASSGTGTGTTEAEARVAAEADALSNWGGHIGPPCIPDDSSDGTIADEYGHIRFQGPGHTWTQGAAVQTGSNAPRPLFSQLMSRGLTASTFHNAYWAILGSSPTRNFDVASDITAVHDAIIGNIRLRNDSSPLVVTVGRNVYAGGWPASGRPAGVPNLDNWGAVNFGSETIIFVGGDLHVRNYQGSWGTGTTGAFGSNVRWYIIGDVHAINSSAQNNVNTATNAGRLHTGAADMNVTINGVTRTVQEWVNRRTNPPGANLPNWNMPSPSPWAGVTAQTLAWGSAPALSDTAIDNLIDRYGVDMSSIPAGRVFYHDGSIDGNARNLNLNPPTGPGGGGSMNVLLIDTGLDPDNVVYVRLNGNAGSGDSGTFRWKTNAEAVARVAVLTLGNGSVVFYIPTGVQYGHVGGVFVGPYNFAIRPNAPANWLNCTRLNNFTYAINRQTEAAWIAGLMTPGTGALRPNIPATGDNGIAPRGHANPLNMNLFFVHNGNNGITLQNRSFLVGSIYTPNARFTAIDGGGDNLLHFGSIAAGSVEINVMDHVISALPGGGIAQPAPPPPANSIATPPNNNTTGDVSSNPQNGTGQRPDPPERGDAPQADGSNRNDRDPVGGPQTGWGQR
ncbi:MAG: hypothetical protein FWF76_06990 [Oscillospiraceae bacterium]|nr:hypothetical protein [Oscillospiraceae bacterium]